MCRGLLYSSPFYQRKVECGVLGFKAAVVEADVLFCGGGVGVGACLRRWRQRGYSADRVVTVGGRSRGVCKQKTGAGNNDAMRCGARAIWTMPAQEAKVRGVSEVDG